MTRSLLAAVAMVEGGSSADTVDWPIGASFQPYLMFPSGFGFGFDAGPQPLTGGDLLRDGSIGVNVGVGVEFSRDRRIGYGFEASYDSCEVEVLQVWRGTYAEENPYGFVASFFLDFRGKDAPGRRASLGLSGRGEILSLPGGCPPRSTPLLPWPVIPPKCARLSGDSGPLAIPRRSPLW